MIGGGMFFFFSPLSLSISWYPNKQSFTIVAFEEIMFTIRFDFPYQFLQKHCSNNAISTVLSLFPIYAGYPDFKGHCPCNRCTGLQKSRLLMMHKSFYYIFFITILFISLHRVELNTLKHMMAKKIYTRNLL